MKHKGREKLWQWMTPDEVAFRRRNIGEWWLTFTRFFRPWIHELTDRYKKRGEFPLSAATLLPSYYTDRYDVEIAAMAGILIGDNKEKLLEHVSEMRLLLGDSPFQWFRSRSFVALSIGENQLLRTAGVLNARIAEYFSNIYDAWRNRELEMSGILMRHFGEDNYRVRWNMLSLILATSDGFGRGLWTVNPHKVKYPLTQNVMSFYHMFFPDYMRYNDLDGAIRLFGFKYDYDIYYAALAYEDLKKRKPKECSRLVAVFQKRYNDGRVPIYREWVPNKPHGILPKIDENESDETL